MEKEEKAEIANAEIPILIQSTLKQSRLFITKCAKFDGRA